MGRIRIKESWRFRPRINDEFKWSNPVQSFKTLGKVISSNKSIEMTFKLLVILIEIAVYSSIFDCAVHPFNLTVRPWVIRLCKAMFNIMMPAYTIENMNTKHSYSSITIFGQVAKLNTISVRIV